MIAVIIRYPSLSVIDRFSGVLMTWDRDLEAEIADELRRCGEDFCPSWEPYNHHSGWCAVVNMTEAQRKKIARAIKIAFQGAVKVS